MSRQAVQQAWGYTLVEVLATVAIGGALVLGLSGVVGTALDTHQVVAGTAEANRSANEAMASMVSAVSQTRRLLLPLADVSATNWPEHIREQTVPASPPVGTSVLATAVLAVSLPATVDLDNDGVPDADNDNDGRLDEDPGADNTADGAPGILLIDDSGDGLTDISIGIPPAADNDEDGFAGDEIANGLDDDGDGNIDEDLVADLNGDGESGDLNVDDDGDGSIDEGSANDDDEDGSADEDGYEPLVFYLDNGTLKLRTPVPWDENADTRVDGADYVTSSLVNNVTRLRIERVPPAGERFQLVDLTLDVADPATGGTVSLNARVRVGGGL